MEYLTVEESEGRLTVARRREPARMRLLLWGLGIAALTALALRAAHPAHGHEFADVQVAAVSFAAASLLLLPGLLRSLRPHGFVLDRARGLVLLNGRLLYPLSELGGVHLEKASWTIQGGDEATLVLWLQTRGQVSVEIVRRGVGGRGELERAARTIAAYTGLNLVLPDGFVPGYAAPADAPRLRGARRRATAPGR